MGETERGGSEAPRGEAERRDRPPRRVHAGSGEYLGRVRRAAIAEGNSARAREARDFLGLIRARRAIGSTRASAAAYFRFGPFPPRTTVTWGPRFSLAPGGRE